jgi:hypothetical protein
MNFRKPKHRYSDLNKIYYIIPEKISHSLNPVARIYFELLFICFIRTRFTFPCLVHNSVGLIRLTCSLPFTYISCRNIFTTFINNCIDVITAIWRSNVLYVLIKGAIGLTVFTGRFRFWFDSWFLFLFCLYIVIYIFIGSCFLCWFPSNEKRKKQMF